MKHIEIESSIDNIPIVEKLVDQLSETYNFNSHVYANILVGVSEAVYNAIIHGNKYDRTKIVQLFYVCLPNSIQFIVKDQGSGFSHYLIPDPTLPENIEKEAGRGIFLMNSLADEVIYNDIGNEVSLKFYL